MFLKLSAMVEWEEWEDWREAEGERGSWRDRELTADAGGWVFECISAATRSTVAMSGRRSGSGVMQSATTALGSVVGPGSLTSGHRCIGPKEVAGSRIAQFSYTASRDSSCLLVEVDYPAIDQETD
jgi:hypothetical protein